MVNAREKQFRLASSLHSLLLSKAKPSDVVYPMKYLKIFYMD